MCKVSVIIPIYNMEDYLDRTLQSVLAQSLTDIEVILVNDGSTDQSVGICRQFQSQDKRVKLFSKENGGQATARNLGLRYATGEYICFVDADDTLEKNYCEALLNLVEPQQLDMGVCNYCYKKNGKIIESYTKVNQDCIEILHDKDFRNEDYLYNYLFKAAGGSPFNKIFRREFLKTNEIYFYHNRYAEDLVFNAVCLQYCKNIGYTCATLYNYEMNIGSTTKLYRENYFKEFIALIEQYENRLKINKTYEKYYKNCAVLVYSAVMNALSNAYRYGQCKAAQEQTLKNIIAYTYSNQYISKIVNEKVLDKPYISFKKRIFSNILCRLILKKHLAILNLFLNLVYQYIG